MIATLTTEENKSDSDARDNRTLTQLDKFGDLASNYVFGKTSGTHIDVGLTLRRSTLLVSFQLDTKIPFGPTTNSKAIVKVASEGEESEIDISDIAGLQSSSQSTLKGNSWNAVGVQR